MLYRVKFLSALVLVFAFSSLFSEEAVLLLSSEKKLVAGEEILFQKFMQGETVWGKITDSGGKELSRDDLHSLIKSKASAYSINESLGNDDNALYSVRIITKDYYKDVIINPSHLEIDIDDFNMTHEVLFNSEYMNIDDYMKQEEENIKDYLSKLIDINYDDYMSDLISALGLPINNVEYGNGYIATTISKNKILSIEERNISDIIDIVIDDHYNINTIADAMLATEIDPYALDYSSRKGNGVNLYMSENKCSNEITGYVGFPPIPIFRYKYDRLSGTTADSHTVTDLGVLRSVAPEVQIYCRENFILPLSTDYTDYDIHIQSHSWGKANPTICDEEYQEFDKSADNDVYNNLVSIFAAAGNYGNGTHVCTPGKALNVIAVGNYDDSNSTITSTLYENSEIGNAKPEISAPGQNINIPGYGSGSGTSLATPHAAAFAADLMGLYTWLKYKPALMKAAMIASANDTLSVYYNPPTPYDSGGFGGINFHDIVYDGNTASWSFNNNQWSSYDDENGYLSYTFSSLASYSRLKAVLVWLNRGTYTYAYKELGMDLDLFLYKPDGSLACVSASSLNPFEVCNIDPTVSGNYTVKIRKWANPDTLSKFIIGLWIGEDGG